MKKHTLLILGILAICTGSVQAQPEYKLWYDRPAERWVEALPLGNGRLGAMVYGNPMHDELQLNEETVWGGSPYNNTNPKAKDALPEIRKLIFEGKNLWRSHLFGGRQRHALSDSRLPAPRF